MKKLILLFLLTICCCSENAYDDVTGVQTTDTTTITTHCFDTVIVSDTDTLIYTSTDTIIQYDTALQYDTTVIMDTVIMQDTVAGENKQMFIDGKIRLEGVGYAAGIVVQFTSFSSENLEIIAYAVTDEKGYFSMYNIPKNLYCVTYQKTGYEVYSMYVHFDYNTTTHIETITLGRQ